MIHNIPTTQTMVDGSKIKPGSTIVLSGIYPVAPYFKNLLDVMITNEGPVSLLSGPKFDNCKEWGLLGNRKDPFRISSPKSGAMGIQVYGRSTDFDLSYLIIDNCSFAGIMCKDDGAKRGGDFTMRNIKIHHCKISKTGGEGLYIGGTNPASHDLEDVEIYENEITDTGWDGVQLGNCVSGGVIRDNKITRTGLNVVLPKDAPQDNGIQVGQRTKGKIYRNKIVDAKGNAIICMGSDCDIYENKLFRAGESGIFSDTRPDSTEGNKFRYNWILVPGMFGIAARDTFKKGVKNLAKDNTIFNPGKQFFENGNDLDPFENNNYTGNDLLFAEHLMKRL